MSAFLVLVVVSVAGVMAVFFLLRSEKHSAGLPLHDLGSTPEARPAEDGPSAFSFPLKKARSVSVEQQAQLPVEEEKRIEREIDLTARLEEWEKKYERLDKLFQEKSTALVKNEELLQTELNNRKEFNKLKDMLEKDLKETRDKARTVQVELNGARAEAESYKKRVNQSEEKVTKMEKALLAKDDEIAGFVKRLEAKPAPPVEAAAPLKPADPDLKAPGGDPVALQAPNTIDTSGKPDPSTTNQNEQKGETNG